MLSLESPGIQWHIKLKWYAPYVSNIWRNGIEGEMHAITLASWWIKDSSMNEVFCNANVLRVGKSVAHFIDHVTTKCQSSSSLNRKLHSKAMLELTPCRPFRPLFSFDVAHIVFELRSGLEWGDLLIMHIMLSVGSGVGVSRSAAMLHLQSHSSLFSTYLSMQCISLYTFLSWSQSPLFIAAFTPWS